MFIETKNGDFVNTDMLHSFTVEEAETGNFWRIAAYADVEAPFKDDGLAVFIDYGFPDIDTAQECLVQMMETMARIKQTGANVVFRKDMVPVLTG